MKRIFLCFALVLGANSFVLAAEGAGSGHGSFIIGGSAGMYNSKDETAGTVNNDLQVSTAEGNIGYVFSSGIYLGGIYGTGTTKVNGAATKPETTFSGASLGYYTPGGFVFQGHFITNAEIKKATATTNRIEGSGSQFDIGFIKNLYGPIFVGAQLSSRSIEYKKLDTSGVKTESKHTVTETFPELRIAFVW
jgi:hypothetical protein